MSVGTVEHAYTEKFWPSLFDINDRFLRNVSKGAQTYLLKTKKNMEPIETGRTQTFQYNTRHATTNKQTKTTIVRNGREEQKA